MRVTTVGGWERAAATSRASASNPSANWMLVLSTVPLDTSVGGRMAV